ncbi:6-phosphogluconolactonase [Roseivirga pacifica]|uniref:6-phosphogluconolactonase n=1 Tax=Roseivirga pacifica TaxID=1267423 RepID=A0A1I0QGJ3_9BACT|nr:6-phosphogluconolactonase [Roseivirga pacifica]RKQ42939.1 6-phosphogluconolactonase [Roseivirga pacifica]SEW26152.1 6-phosphogluconolactonase [Roseivirga pacifica]
MKHIISSDAQGTAQAFAEFLIDQINQSNTLNIALSGGSTPKILFELLADEYEEEVDWNKVNLYWGDERCVPPTDGDSNYKMTNDLLITQVSIPDSNVHRVLGENEPEGEAARYGKDISDNLPAANGLPQFDIIILGMGGDGHTASIFPHELELMNDERVCAIGVNPDSGQKRVTLTGPVINNAKHVCFLVTGEGKAEKIDEIFNKKEGSEKYPAAHIAPTDGTLTWYMDQAAAVKL